VPIWWTRNKIPSFLFEPLPNGHFGIDLFEGPAQELSLTGQVVRTVDTAGGPSDFHDFRLLPDGNYVLVTGQQQQHDLRPWGGPASGTVVNNVFQVITPGGQVIWSWDTSQHIPITETPPTWRAEPEPLTGDTDPWHYNSVEWTGDGFIISFRHLDALYKVDYPSGAISWKLGGTARPESLSAVGDPVFASGGSFSGQHDARVLADGTVTLFDNGSRANPARLSRSVRYRLDLAARTATLLEAVTDPIGPGAACCGSARKLSGGNWVTAFGGTPNIVEQRPDGSRAFYLRSTFAYRAIPIPHGRIAPSAFRAGMDAQYAA
jgi:Arylsulfotransferase (ASST)